MAGMDIAIIITITTEGMDTAVTMDSDMGTTTEADTPPGIPMRRANITATAVDTMVGTTEGTVRVTTVAIVAKLFDGPGPPVPGRHL